MSRLLQIYEDDVALLERALPLIHEALGTALNRPDVQVALEECKRIVSDVRWGYGPHTNVEVVR